MVSNGIPASDRPTKGFSHWYVIGVLATARQSGTLGDWVRKERANGWPASGTEATLLKALDAVTKMRDEEARIVSATLAVFEEIVRNEGGFA